MTRLSLCILILVGAASPVSAQSVELFHVVSDEVVRGSAADRLLSVRHDKSTLKADAVSFLINAKDILKRPQFEINLPYMGKPIVFQTLGYWAKSDSLFIWQGRSDGQYARFVVYRGNLTGGFSVGSNSFDLVSATPGVSVLQLLDPQRPKGGDLVLDEHAGLQEIISKREVVSVHAGGMSGSSQIDVLFVTSPLTSFDEGAANTAEMDLNASIVSSGATGSMHVVGVVEDIELPDHVSASTVLNYLATNSAIASLRDAYGADVLAAVVDSLTGDVDGAVPSIKPPANNAFLVSRRETVNKPNKWTFVHEMGHIVGGRHDGDVGITPYEFGHGFWALTPKVYFSLMSRENPIQRTLTWSRPEENYGTAHWNDVARVWTLSAPDVAAYRSPTTPPSGDLTVSIHGPTSMQHKENCEFQAEAYFDTGLANPCTNCTYSWFEKPTWSSTWTNMVVSTPTILYTLFDSPGADLRVDVSSSTQMASTSVTILEGGTGGCGLPPGAKAGLTSDLSPGVVPSDLSVDVYPNPARDRLVIRVVSGSPVPVHFAVYDVLGRVVAEFSPSRNLGSTREVEWHIGSQLAGVYFLRTVFDGGATSVEKIVISK